MAEDPHRPARPASDEAFEHLYRAHRRAVYRFVLREVRDPQEAEDVTQIAFLDAYRALARGNRPDEPRPWLFTIARNASRRRFRREQPYEVPLEETVPVVDPNAAQAAAREIVSAVLGLSRRHREVLLMREVRGASAAETARALGTSVASVEMSLFRARREVRGALERAGVAPEARSLPALLGLVASRLARLGVLSSPAIPASSVGVVGLGALVVALGGASGSARPAADVAAGPLDGVVAQAPAIARPEVSRGSHRAVAPLAYAPAPPQYAPAKIPELVHPESTGDGSTPATTPRKDEPAPAAPTGATTTPAVQTVAVSPPRVPVAPAVPVEVPDVPPVTVPAPPPPPSAAPPPVTLPVVPVVTP
jgi:RNA polymerase sigma-70 factor (ECF subfamily)